jgi:mycothiol system anti-sigma-R factor
MIDCPEAVRRMWNYLDQALERTSTDELEQHLETCQRCCGELEFSRHVREKVAVGDGALALPPDLRARIDRLIDRPSSASGGER